MGHHSWVRAVAVSGDGELIASGDQCGDLIVWDGLEDAQAGESLTWQGINGHNGRITSLDFSPDRKMLASVSSDNTIKLWRIGPRQIHGNPININIRADIYCVRYSPSGKLLAVATFKHIQIWNPSMSECIMITNLTVNSFSLAWTPDGTRLLSAGYFFDPTIREWDTSTWNQVGDPWCAHTDAVNAIAVNSTGTLVVSVSEDHYLCLWRLSDRRLIAIFHHPAPVYCVAFSTDDKFILSGGYHTYLSEWGVPEDALLEVTHTKQASDVNYSSFSVPPPSHLAQGDFARQCSRGADDEQCEFLLGLSPSYQPNLLLKPQESNTKARSYI